MGAGLGRAKEWNSDRLASMKSASELSARRVDADPTGVGPRDEPRAQRNNRNLSDLLQELRVAGLGVQVLFGFLLSLPFTVRFTKLDGGQQDVYRATLLCTALSTALLISPVAYHRWLFRRHEKDRLLRTANVLALFGLAAVALAISLAIWLIMSFLGASWIMITLSAATSGTFALLWFVLPILDRLRSDPQSCD
jgi:O-antigen/teichoic acid export membrane protein